MNDSESLALIKRSVATAVAIEEEVLKLRLTSYGTPQFDRLCKLAVQIYCEARKDKK